MSRSTPTALLIAVAFVLPGCATWIDQEPGCTFDVFDWSDDLLSNIMSGDGSGAFDYDPEDTPRNNIKGSYDVDSGDYMWSIDYAASYFIIDGKVSGYGTAYHNGDLDILQATTSTDVLGAQFVVNERTRREGCKMTSELWSQDDQSDLLTQVGTYKSASDYEWSADVSGYTYKGSWHANLSRTETLVADDGSYSSQITTKPEGTASGDIAFTQGGYDFSGTYKRRFDGGVEEALTETKNGDAVATIATDYNYDGSGTETQSYADGTRCDFTTTADQTCSYTCSDGSSGGC